MCTEGRGSPADVWPLFLNASPETPKVQKRLEFNMTVVRRRHRRLEAKAVGQASAPVTGLLSLGVHSTVLSVCYRA